MGVLELSNLQVGGFRFFCFRWSLRFQVWGCSVSDFRLEPEASGIPRSNTETWNLKTNKQLEPV